MIYSTVFVVISLILYQTAISAPQKVPQLTFQYITVIDSSFDNKKILLPRLMDSTLWILANEVLKLDSVYNYYTLYTPATNTSYKLILPDSNTHSNHIVEYFVEDNRIILIDLVSILVFSRNEEEQWSLTDRVPLTYTVTHARKEKNTIYLWNDVPSSYSAKNSRFYCYSFDMETRKEGELLELPEPAGAEFMYVHPRNVLDRTEQIIVLADITQYAVRIYSSDTSSVDTLARQPEHWRQSVLNLHIPRGSTSPQQYFPKLDSARRMSSLISRVTLLTDSTLLIIWSTPAQDRQLIYTADIWCRKSGKWHLELKDIPVNHSNDSLAFNLPEAPVSINYVYNDGMFLDVLLFPLNHNINDRWKTYAEYKKELDTYFSTRSLQYIVAAKRFEL
jgi:hypothetical protein